MQIDFSEAFDIVIHRGIVVYTDSFYQTDHRTLWWMVDGSKLVNVVSGEPQEVF